MLNLVKRLKRDNEFRWGRRLLEKADLGTYPDNLRLRAIQEWALCNYKDPDRPALKALREAIVILGKAGNPATANSQETLGLAGAICKRLWQITGQKQFLEQSLFFYRRGYQLGPAADDRYTSINAAFVLDQLAAIEEADSAPSAQSRRDEAHNIRQNLTQLLPQLHAAKPDLLGNWWYLVTVAEAYFGLQEYCQAGGWLQM